jgi:CubicO group peptidase (beta-lactamase class C family)
MLPSYVQSKAVTIDPSGPDGWPACVDEMALGKADGERNTKTLWTKPGGGYSYATSSIHLVSMMIRHLAGMELERFVDERLARPMGWGRWGWRYRRAEVMHTCGGGGIAPRATDMARFGYLLLRGGRWGGRQIAPAEYVRHCSRLSRYNPHYPYSLQFEVNADGHVRGAPRDAFWKTGSGGHCLYVVPSLDLVIWKLGGRDEQYGAANTGLAPLPESKFPYDGSREGWARSVDDETAARRTLEMICTAVRR